MLNIRESVKGESAISVPGYVTVCSIELGGGHDSVHG